MTIFKPNHFDADVYDAFIASHPLMSYEKFCCIAPVLAHTFLFEGDYEDEELGRYLRQNADSSFYEDIKIVYEKMPSVSLLSARFENHIRPRRILIRILVASLLMMEGADMNDIRLLTPLLQCALEHTDDSDNDDCSSDDE